MSGRCRQAIENVSSLCCQVTCGIVGGSYGVRVEIAAVAALLRNDSVFCLCHCERFEESRGNLNVYDGTLFNRLSADMS
ncbi:MAG: hypothetical protein ACYSWO_20540 [Planctomycetota bacterium]